MHFMTTFSVNGQLSYKPTKLSNRISEVNWERSNTEMLLDFNYINRLCYLH